MLVFGGDGQVGIGIVDAVPWTSRTGGDLPARAELFLSEGGGLLFTLCRGVWMAKMSNWPCGKTFCEVQDGEDGEHDDERSEGDELQRRWSRVELQAGRQI